VIGRRTRALDRVGTTLGAALLGVSAVAAAWFEATAPRAPDVFTGRVYALALPGLHRVYLGALQHDMLAIGAIAGAASVAVSLLGGGRRP
jgi:hypothetical protein